MPHNEFTGGELYRFITGIASTAVARRLQKYFREEGLEITMEQWSLLYHLWRHDGLSQQELSQYSFRDKPSITRLVNNMEKQNLVRRKPSKEDKRINQVFLTIKGSRLHTTTMQMANKTLREALAGVSVRDIEICKSVLHKVYENLQCSETESSDAGKKEIYGSENTITYRQRR